MSRWKAFTSQPDSRNSTASQSSSSGCDGGSPLTPKSPLVRTMPVPKTSCQKRLTVTRAVSGCSGRRSHWANPRRVRGRAGGIGGRGPRRGRGGLHLVAALVVVAAEEDESGRLLGLLLHDVGDRPARPDRGLLLLQGARLAGQRRELRVHPRQPPGEQLVRLGRGALVGRL